MTTGSTARDEGELEAFLARQSSLSADYDSLGPVEPPAALDEMILALAKVAAQSAAARGTPAAGARRPNAPGTKERPQEPRPPSPETDDEDDIDDEPPPRRPRWLLPVAVAAVVSVLVAAGVGLTMFPSSPSGTSNSSFVGSLFAKRARERSEADKAAAAAAAQQEAEVIVLESPPLPPPILKPEGPQVQDLDAAIVLIRKELVLANQTTSVAAEAAVRDKAPAALSGNQAAAGAPSAAPGVIQPRERRLNKILELYDAGNKDLAADSLEIFLRDFEDDPISQRIIGAKP